MKALYTLTLVLVGFCLHGQTDSLEFVITEYWSGKEETQRYQHIANDGSKLDLWFYQKHFYLPYYLPREWKNAEHINEEVEYSECDTFETGVPCPKDIYVYDSLGRVASFGNTSCVICAHLPYEYEVTYGYRGEVLCLIETHYLENHFEFVYDDNENIIELMHYRTGMQGLKIQFKQILKTRGE